MLSQLRVLVAARQRNAHCRRNGHAWTDMAYPPACVYCGRTRVASAGVTGLRDDSPAAA
jgi:hypothetical protein